MMLGEIEIRGHLHAAFMQGPLDLQRCPELLPHPQRYRHEERLQPGWRNAKVGLQDATELAERLVVEGDGVKFVGPYLAFPEAVAHRVGWYSGVLFLAREPFLLGGGHDPAIPHQRRGGIMVERTDAENIHLV